MKRWRNLFTAPLQANLTTCFLSLFPCYNSLPMLQNEVSPPQRLILHQRAPKRENLFTKSFDEVLYPRSPILI